MKSKFCIVSLSKSSWSFPFWTSRQCLMYELAAHCDVYYLNEREHWRNLLQPSCWKERQKQKENQPFAPPKNLHVINPGYRYPFFYGKGGLNEYFRHKLVADLKRKVAQQSGVPICAYVWHPDCLEYLDKLQPAKVIYHPYDRFSEFCNNQQTKEKLVQREQELVRIADAVITPHTKIAETLNHPNTHIVSNAVFSPAFQNNDQLAASSKPEIFTAIPSPRIGYIGGINEKVDFQLLSAVAGNRPDWSIILMGPQGNKRLWGEEKSYLSLKEKRNVYFFDGVNFKDVATYMHWFDVGCMPYSMKGWMSFCQSPLKLYQYWALGKPVVSTPLPKLIANPGILSIGETSQRWIEAIEWELKNDCKIFREKRKQLAGLNSWKKKAEDVYTILQSL